MKNIFNEVSSLDKKSYDKYHLSEDILQEHAALGMAKSINKHFKNKNKILIACGVGNNGADGLALARLLQDKFKVCLYLPFELKSPMAKLQFQRAKSCGIKIITKIKKYDIVVDCLFGSGLSRKLDYKSITIIKKLNKLKAYKIACDIPSGISNDGKILGIGFKADVTFSMGALTLSLFGDLVKDYVGDIKVVNLGYKQKLYEQKSNIKLLQANDLKLPFRKIQNSNKGDFGHLGVILGDKKGAGILACKTALGFGVGLVSAIVKNTNIPCEIMSSVDLPDNITALAVGMGLGDKTIKLDNQIPTVVDADMFYKKEIKNIITSHNNLVLTPHPKEFCSLLKLCNIVDIDIKTLQSDRFGYVEMFCKTYPKVVLLLKGANTIIAQDKKIFINPLGTSALSFGGSGDILSGLIAALLAQGYSPLKSAIYGSLTHTLGAKKYKYSDFSLTPKKLIKQIGKL